MFYLFPTTDLLCRCCSNVTCFNASLSGRIDSIKNVGYLWNPKLNIYYVAAKETMKSGLLPRILAYAGSVSIERT